MIHPKRQFYFFQNDAFYQGFFFFLRSSAHPALLICHNNQDFDIVILVVEAEMQGKTVK